MVAVVCFRCRQEIPPEYRVCPRCGIVPGELAMREWAALVTEKEFLLARAAELTDPRVPRFLGIPVFWLVRLVVKRPDIERSELKSEDPGWETEGLIEAVRGGEGAFRAEAAMRLGIMGAHTPEAVLAIALALKEPNPRYRLVMYWAISEVGTPALVRPLMVLLEREHDSECWSWLRAALLRVCGRRLDAGMGGPPAEEGLLTSVGKATRAWEMSGGSLPEALFHRSQLFLLMGKPMFALDDFLLCPRSRGGLDALYEKHRAGLIMVCKDLHASCEAQGLDGMASLFAARLRLLETA